MDKRKRILMVDDDPDFVAAITAVLESSGYEVRSARDGQEGFETAKAIRPDLVLLDVMMRERTEGFFTLQRLKADPVTKPIPVIVMSSIYADQPVFRVDPDAGWLPANLFLAKPVDPGRLLAEVARLTSGDAATPISPLAAARGDHE